MNATLPLHITKTFYTHTYSNTNVHHIDQNIIRQTTNHTHQTTSCSPIAIAILPMCITETFYTHPHIHALSDINQIICIVNYKSINLNESGLDACAVHMARHFIERARHEARRQPLATKTHKFVGCSSSNITHIGKINSEDSGVLTEDLRRRGGGCAAQSFPQAFCRTTTIRRCCGAAGETRLRGATLPGEGNRGAVFGSEKSSYASGGGCSPWTTTSSLRLLFCGEERRMGCCIHGQGGRRGVGWSRGNKGALLRGEEGRDFLQPSCPGGQGARPWGSNAGISGRHGGRVEAPRHGQGAGRP
jgi:hypothetical protein